MALCLSGKLRAPLSEAAWGRFLRKVRKVGPESGRLRSQEAGERCRKCPPSEDKKGV